MSRTLRAYALLILLSLVLISCSGGGGGASDGGGNASAISDTPIAVEELADLNILNSDPNYDFTQAELDLLMSEGNLTQEDYDKLSQLVSSTTSEAL